MPRDGSGNYTLPVGNPVVSDTVIASDWANDTMSDIATQLNNVLTRDGVLGPVLPFKLVDGNVNTPGLGFNSEPGLGLFRINTSILGFSAAGKQTIVNDASSSGSVITSLYPRSTGQAELRLNSDIYGTADTTSLRLFQTAAGGGIQSMAIGAGTVKPIFYTASEHQFAGSVRAIPNPNNSDISVDRVLGNSNVGSFFWKTGNVARFAFEYSAPAGEGSNAGFLSLNRYDNSGNPIASLPGSALMQFNRQDGSVNFSGTVTGGSNVGGGGTGFSTPQSIFAGGNLTVSGTGSFGSSVTLAAGQFVAPSSGFYTLRAGTFGTSGSTRINGMLQSSGDIGFDITYQFNHNPGVNAYARTQVGTNFFDMLNSGTGQSLGGWVATSDIRLKSNFALIDGALEKVRKLHGYTFDREDMMDLSGRVPRKAGYAAQEIQAVLPEAVLEGLDEMKTLSVDHNGVIGLLIEAVKELDARTQIH
jgi:hypothetical protein